MEEQNRTEYLTEKLFPRAKELVVKNKIRVNMQRRKIGKPRAKRPRKIEAIYMDDGCDLLENFHVIRMYVCKKYGINLKILEILCYFYPKGHFTWADYKELPKDYRYLKFDKMEELGLLAISRNSKLRKDKLFTLSRKAKTIVVKMHSYLTGQDKVPEIANPLNKQGGTKQDKMRFDLIKKINKTEPSDNKKRYFGN